MTSRLTTSATPSPVILVGCGAVSQQFYLPALRTLQAAHILTVHALVDPSEPARARLAKVFPSAQSTATLENVTAPENALCIIASPPRFHAAQTLAAFARGWHVLCEKPMASSVVEADEMIVAAQRHKRLLAVGLYKRFFPSSEYLRALCQDELLGPLVHFTIAEGGPFRWPAATRSFFDRAQTPGGVLLDIGVHVLDLLGWWLGDPVAFNYADDAMGGLETNSRLELSFASGARGLVHLSRDWRTANLYTFVFERAVVRWRVNDANGLSVQLANAPAGLQGSLVAPAAPEVPGPAPRLLDSNAQSFIAQIRNVVSAIAGEASLLIPGEEGARSLRLIEKAYGQRTLIEQPWLTPTEAARAREIASSTCPVP